MAAFSNRPARAICLAVPALLLGGLPALAQAVAVGRVPASFEVDPAGAAVYSVPITVAAGRGGLRPTLALRYRSQDGDGPAGMGTSLAGLSRVHRCPRTIAVDGRVEGVRFTTSDRFCLDGQPLVLVGGSYGGDGAEYRTEVHDLLRVVSRGRQGSGPASFDIQHPDGRIWSYGNDADSRTEALGTAGEVREWALNQVRDKFGNQILYTYSEDPSTGESLPAEIRWSADGAGNGARFRVVLAYEPRPADDQRVIHGWGATWQRARRLRSIRYEFDGGAGFGLVHGWNLSYAAGGSRRSQLSGIQQCGPTQCLPATTIGWQSGASSFEGAGAGPTDPLAGDAMFGDHDGDGDTDIYVPVTVGGVKRWHLRPANPSQAAVYTTTAVNTGVAVNGTAYLLEYDGDGRRDLLAAGAGSPANWYVYRSDGATGFLAAIDTGLSTATAAAPVPLDADGDGLDDLLYARNFALYLRRNTGNGFGPEQATSIGPSGTGQATAVAMLDGSGAGADFDGDGRQDVLLTRGSLNLSGPRGHFEALLSTGTDFVSLLATPPATIALTADVNGDGLTDLLYQDASLGWQVRRSLGNGFAPAEAAGLPSGLGAYGAVLRTLDLDGDGRDDFLRRLDNGTWRIHLAGGGITGPVYSDTDPSRYVDLGGAPAPSVTTRLVATDFTGDGLPDLLFTESTGRWQVRRHATPRPDQAIAFTDGLGNTWQPAYAALSGLAAYRTDGTAAVGELLLRGGALQVVSNYAASDGAGGSYTVAYEYWNGRQSRLGRGFLGFGRIRSTDSRYQAMHGVAVYRETSYRQDFPFIGLPDRVVTARGDGQRISISDPTWSVHIRSTPAAEAAGDYHFVYPSAETQEEYETDPDGGALGQLRRTTTVTRSYDFNHGVPVRESTTVSSPASSATHNTVTVTTLDDNLKDTQYCLGLPLRVEVTRDISGLDASTRITQYDWFSPHCRPWRELANAQASAGSRLATTYAWTSGGQLASVIRAPSDGSEALRRTSYTYDNWSDRPRTESATVTGQATPVTARTWHYGLDVELSQTSPRGVTTSWAWDEFGRLKQETRADGPATSYVYSGCAGTCFAPKGVYQLMATRSDGSWTLAIHDGYGRIVGREFPLVGGETSRQIMAFDPLGRLSRETVPYVEGDAQFWIDYRYDVAGQRIAEDRPADDKAGGMASTRWTSSRLTRTIRDAENRTSTQNLDPEGRLIGVTAPDGATASYRYTPFGELAGITDAGGVTTNLGYDGRGLLSMADSPDSGRRSTTWNAFGELLTQTDALGRVISFRYDQLGRLTQRTQTGKGPTTWEYIGASGPQLGLPVRVTAPLGTAPTGFSEQYAYDSLGRRTQVTTTMDGKSYVTNYGWDSLGRVSTMLYPVSSGGSRLSLAYRYGPTGYLDSVEQDISGGGGMFLRLWQLRSLDALTRPEHVQLASFYNIDERRVFDRASTRLTGIRTGANQGTEHQNYLYVWDKAGNLRQRQDLGQGLMESFAYDGQDRLTEARLNGTLTLSLRYDAAGRIRSKSDVGNYVYDSSHPGAVTAVGGGPRGILYYAYDANGNMTQRNGRPITWDAAQLPERIEYGPSESAVFDYGPDRQRIRQTARSNGVLVTTDYIGPHFEVESRGGKRRYRSTIFANGQAFYVSMEQDDPATYDAYFLHRDHLGSVDTLSRFVGTGTQKLAQRFDAHGKRRNADWTADPADLRMADAHFTERGFTGHEHLDDARLIHMNGRLQDPVLGVMLSPDPVLGSLGDPATLQRYAYVAHNPTSAVDPSGYFLGKIGDFFKRVVRRFGNFLRRVVRNYGREILAAVAGYYTAGLASQAYLAAAPAAGTAAGNTIGAVAGGAVAGGIASGDIQGMVQGAIGGGIFGGIGGAYGNRWTAGRVLTNAAAGGALAHVSGGEFRRGFAFAGGAAGFGLAYDRLVGYQATWAAGGPAQSKNRFTLPYEGANNIGEASRVVNPDSIWGEGGRISRVLNRLPGVNAVAGVHDVLQVGLDQTGGAGMRAILNIPGMPLAAALTYPALMEGVPAVALAEDE